DLLLPPDIVQLKTDKSFSIRREHFEPDEVIFREGDRGDWLYVVVEGQVEVHRSVPGRGDVTLRTLGAGECLGESALVGESARTATVWTRSSGNLLAVVRRAFLALL